MILDIALGLLLATPAIAVIGVIIIAIIDAWKNK